LRTFLNQQIISTHDELNELRQLGNDSEFAETVSSFRRAQLETILEWLTAYQAAETTRGARHPTGAKKRKNK